MQEKNKALIKMKTVDIAGIVITFVILGICGFMYGPALYAELFPTSESNTNNNTNTQQNQFDPFLQTQPTPTPPVYNTPTTPTPTLTPTPTPIPTEISIEFIPENATENDQATVELFHEYPNGSLNLEKGLTNTRVVFSSIQYNTIFFSIRRDTGYVNITKVCTTGSGCDLKCEQSGENMILTNTFTDNFCILEYVKENANSVIGRISFPVSTGLNTVSIRYQYAK